MGTSGDFRGSLLLLRNTGNALSVPPAVHLHSAAVAELPRLGN
jgi:hypothetical protein